MENICQRVLMDLADTFRVDLESVPRFIKRNDSLGLNFIGHWQLAGWPDLQLQLGDTLQTSAGQAGPSPAASAVRWHLSVVPLTCYVTLFSRWSHFGSCFCSKIIGEWLMTGLRLLQLICFVQELDPGNQLQVYEKNFEDFFKENILKL